MFDISTYIMSNSYESHVQLINTHAGQNINGNRLIRYVSHDVDGHRYDIHTYLVVYVDLPTLSPSLPYRDAIITTVKFVVRYDRVTDEQTVPCNVNVVSERVTHL